jgi:Protein of unknown function (DUF3365)
MTLHRWWLLLALTALGCVSTPPVASAPTLTETEEAAVTFDRLQRALQERLTSAMQAGGPVAAIDACHLEAAPLTAQVANQRGVRVGRTSARLRNAANAPPAWAVAQVAATEGKQASEVSNLVVDLGTRVGVLRPIATAPLCLTCHGPNLAPAVSEAVAAHYPNDRAVGFTEGSLRGFFWAEVPKRR